jgi:Peptidase family M20/M25/M40
MGGSDLLADLDAFLAGHEAELIEFRRDLHAHPELAFSEHRTTRRVALRLAAAGLRPAILPKGTGVIVDVGSEQVPNAERPVVALRADMDALPMQDVKDVPYRSTVDGVCHACGHDVHTTVLVGTGLFLAAQAEASSSSPRRRRPAGRSMCWPRAVSTRSAGFSRCTATLAWTRASSACARARSRPPATRSKSGSPAQAGTRPART